MIKTALDMIASKDIDWQKLIANGEWIGYKMEDEIDRARRDEINERESRTTRVFRR